MTHSPSFWQRLRQESRVSFTLALPIAVGQLASMAMSVVDSLLAGRHGPITLAAVAVGSAVWSLAMLICIGLMMAIPPTVSQLNGAGRRADIGPIWRQALWLALAAGLLLLGFMAGKVKLELADVNEVLKDLSQESALPPPSKPVSIGIESESDSQLGLDLDLSRQPPQAASSLQEFERQLDGQVHDLHAERLLRLERSLLRLERINLQNLKMLQRLVKALQRPDAGVHHDQPNP